MSIRIETLGVFPQMFEPIMSLSIMGRARRGGYLDFRAHDLRDWTHDRHRTVDDSPYGGGQGMLMMCEPLFEAFDELVSEEDPAYVVFFTPTGRPFNQAMAEELSHKERILFVCGHYEGMDERVYSRADLCLSLGDYVLTGGELAALTVTDAVVRLIPGVLGDDQSCVDESFGGGLLEYSQYTRPASCRDMEVPAVLLEGDPSRVAAWRRADAIVRTCARRPDMIATAELTCGERLRAEELIARLAQGEDCRQVACELFDILRLDVEVPQAILKGDRSKVAAWRRADSIARTCASRPDLIATADLTKGERRRAEKLISRLAKGQDFLQASREVFGVLRQD